ncbi:MAG: hypothetical protein AAB874_01100, partial [Patescibacteria group bacterium]
MQHLLLSSRLKRDEDYNYFLYCGTILRCACGTSLPRVDSVTYSAPNTGIIPRRYLAHICEIGLLGYLGIIT